MLVGFGIVLLIAGAVASFALDARIDDVGLAATGWMLMAAGALSTLLGGIRGTSWTVERRVESERRREVDQYTIDETWPT